MSIGTALLVSVDPVTIEQFSHALQELSISPDVCHEVAAAVSLLNRRKFDAVIVNSGSHSPKRQSRMPNLRDTAPERDLEHYQNQRHPHCNS